MQATVDQGKVEALGAKLKSGHEELEGILTSLNGQAVAEIHQALAGTSTADAFDSKVSELITQLKAALPAFDALAAFIDNFVRNFDEADKAQAAALRG
ncbi:MAG TPA: hypothetical protein VFR07_05190 [Mycobacteriales bacterium]|jgi:uncharacterized protein YukE|nr:hypothetical protein [Mycobacteriales bacterium]